ncbi:MAG: bifunctional hydroxymethylpyrimidine kinase/phosphomethylpyrimidine kinase [Pseudomonadota bacterium]
MQGRVLTIAGSDPSGGAGIQADIKTITALGGYAMAAVTALTVQNTMGVSRVSPVEPKLIREQIDACLSDIGADAIKIGVVPTIDAADAISETLAGVTEIPIVLDPVMVATSGDALSKSSVIERLIDHLGSSIAVVTPNTDELNALVRRGGADAAGLKTVADVIDAGKELSATLGKPVLAKGGHLSGDRVVDALIANGSVREFSKPRLDTSSTHGTGCTLASVIATGLAQGLALEESCDRAIQFVHEAIRTAPQLGKGRGPLNHTHGIST